MNKDTVIQVILRLRDELGGQAKKTLGALTQATRGVTKGFESAGKAARTLGVTRDATGHLVGAGRAASVLAREVGQGARAEKDLTREARTTKQEIDESARSSGRLAKEVNQAAQAEGHLEREAKTAKREIDETAKAGGRLANALTRAGTAGKTAWGAIRGIGQAGAGMAAGTVAGAAVVGRALARPISFEKRMTLMANTAYADEKDPAKRLAGRATLVDAVNSAVRQGGGTRDQAAEALDSMLSSNAVKADTAKNLLPTIQKFSSASGASSGDIAEIVIRGIQQGFFKEGQAGEALDKALAAGQAGGFELKDMAKWLPKMMAMGSGMKGMAGYEQILAYAQAAATTAGSKDEAGNNLVNLLQKINSQDTKTDFAKLGIDLTGNLVKAREKGILPLEAFARLIEKQVAAKDPRYKALQKKLGSAQGNEKKQILGDMADLASASAVGKVIQDRQALLALIAAMNQKDYIKDVQARMHDSAGEGDRSYAVYQGSTAAHLERTANEADIARGKMLSDVSGPLKDLADAATDLAQRFPRLATVVTETSSAIGVISAGMLAAGGYRMLTGAGAAAAGGGVAASVAGLAKGAVSGAARLAPWALGATAAWDIYSTEKDATLTRAQKNIAHSETYGATGGALAGAAMGATAGSVVPGLGTAIGGLLGGIVGWFAGGRAGKYVGNAAFGGPSQPDPATLQAAHQLAQPRQETIKFESVLHLDGREIARAVNQYNKSESLRD